MGPQQVEYISTVSKDGGLIGLFTTALIDPNIQMRNSLSGDKQRLHWPGSSVYLLSPLISPGSGPGDQKALLV